MVTPAISSRSICCGTKPSRNASTSASVMGRALEDASGFWAAGIFGARGFTFGFCPQDRVQKHSNIVAATARTIGNWREEFSNKTSGFSCGRFIGFSMLSMCGFPFRDKRAVRLIKDQLIHLTTGLLMKFHAEPAESPDSKFQIFLAHKSVGRLARHG